MTQQEQNADTPQAQIQKESQNQQDVLQIKGSIFTVLVIYIKQTELSKIRQALTDYFVKCPDFFENAPIVLDFQAIKMLDPNENQLDISWFSEIVKLLRSNGIVVVGVRNALPNHEALASQIGLGIMPESDELNQFNKKVEDSSKATESENEQNSTSSSLEESAVIQKENNQVQAENNATEKPKEVLITTIEAELEVNELDSSELQSEADDFVESVSRVKIIRHPVRSGQSIRAENADLIILAPVSSGAEIIADGHIHVYSSLKGRALAGASGDKSARIFIHKMEAQLVSIAGYYKIIDDSSAISAYGKPSQVYLDGEKLIVEALIK